MAKKISKPKVNFNLEPKNLFWLLKLSILHPKQFAQAIPLEGGFQQPLIFSLLITIISSLLRLIVETATKLNASVFFLGISSIIFTLPVAILGIFLQTAVIFVIARGIKGQGSFRSTFRACAYSALPGVLSFIPFIGILAYILSLFILILSIIRVHKFSAIRSTIAVLTPFLVLLVILAMLGLLFLNFGKNFNIPSL